MPTTILIVDDDFDLRETLKDLLSDEGYTVAVAANGFEALAYLRNHAKPCLILLDWMMPHCDGAQFRAEQRQDPAIADIPVVIISADVRLRQTYEANEVAGYLVKPFQLHHLSKLIARFCPQGP
jgi:CheY-like chemotaxis protein